MDTGTGLLGLPAPWIARPGLACIVARSLARASRSASRSTSQTLPSGMGWPCRSRNWAVVRSISSAVGPELAGGQERLLGVLVTAGEVVHGHGRRRVSRVTLENVDGQPQLRELG